MTVSLSVKLVSLLDTDLYKFTMQQAVLNVFPDVVCTYRFTNRTPSTLFSKECIDIYQKAVSNLANVSLTKSECEWLRASCPFFKEEYISYLSSYRFKPNQVSITFVESPTFPGMGTVQIETKGLWVETILWEVPLMSLLSEAYFKTVDRDWDYEGQEDLAYRKGKALLENGITFLEFGTRRRRSQRTHDLVVAGLKRATEDISGPNIGRMVGTSNVYLAYKHGLKPSGTIAHEWFMAIGALMGYEHVNGKAMDVWHSVYGTANLIALTDTFTTDVFFQDFTGERARLWSGIRQDSGDPFVYAPKAKAVYESLGVDYKERFIVYSDSVNVELAINLKKQCDELGFKAMFGIGTNFTNDFQIKSSEGKEKSKALNMVIKLSSVNDLPCVKLSDEPHKHTGEPAAIEHVRAVFGMND
ncbi:hypothetical protein Clacol_010404 [Clathrus columnatus]|uniref:Nicotinate phosphoribosyltransferase n=1 Tax=Clathrus columnatus TaxID=1419009 RepID=A0AAV5ANE0_9AGAM|nr:hypothetical protein Clacol_010404 [Clathrus columnatus]